MSGQGWIAVDLDGTLAEYGSWKGMEHIGPPIPRMVARVRRWLAEGREVRIFTARVSARSPAERSAAVLIIRDWCRTHIGVALEVTHEKDFACVELWDDRAVAVEQNTGRALNDSRRGLESFLRCLCAADRQPALGEQCLLCAGWMA